MSRTTASKKKSSELVTVPAYSGFDVIKAEVSPPARSCPARPLARVMSAAGRPPGIERRMSVEPSAAGQLSLSYAFTVPSELQTTDGNAPTN